LLINNASHFKTCYRKGMILAWQPKAKRTLVFSQAVMPGGRQLLSAYVSLENPCEGRETDPEKTRDRVMRYLPAPYNQPNAIVKDDALYIQLGAAIAGLLVALEKIAIGAVAVVGAP